MPPKSKKHCYDYPRPSVTVDLVAFTYREKELQVLTIKRKSPPFEGSFALPGGFLEMDEEPEEAVIRETREETGLALVGQVFPLGFYAAVDRDPRGRTVSLAHVAIIRSPAPEPVGGDDAAEALWVPLPVLSLESMAFDHEVIVDDAASWLNRLLATPVTLNAFLPEEFDERDVRELLRHFGWSSTSAGPWCRQTVEQGLCEPLPGKKKRYRSLVSDATELRPAKFKG